MNTQPHRPHGWLASIAAGVLLITLAAVWLPKAEFLWTISSSEVDDLLYRNLDDYQGTIDRSEALQSVMRKALTAPETLTDSELRSYVEHERRFFSGWEMVFNYGEGGYLAEDRFQVWDNWYRNEKERRPEFAWTENRTAYSIDFAAHVDGLPNSRTIQLSECGPQPGNQATPDTSVTATGIDCGTQSPANNR